MAGQQLSRIFLPNKTRRDLRDKMQVIESNVPLLKVYRIIVLLSLVSAIGLGVYSFFMPSFEFYRLFNKIVLFISVIVISFFIFYAVYWLLFISVINLRIYYRMRQIEANLPDYLGFTAANLRAGMPIDKALWLAIRPRFGPLAKEMEIVAKRTMSGDDLNEALNKFANKYDSKLLKRAVSLLNEGLSAGGKISDLISRISWNLDEVTIMKKEISANVMNYVIFIGFATLIAAPLLFGLCAMLLSIITSLQGILGSATQVASTQAIPVTFMQTGVTLKDFNIYAYLSLGITASFSSMIISIIRKGNIKDGLKYIPIFALLSILLYIAASRILGLLFSGIF
ncbi:type II secretion system F family protein [Candidatus Woesearchaeota archaeon]|nr:type II secretion system F family protein [Candidatus Woesearchaeota archaeon]